jgi:hypothetical protein
MQASPKEYGSIVEGLRNFKSKSTEIKRTNFWQKFCIPEVLIK